MFRCFKNLKQGIKVKAAQFLGRKQQTLLMADF